MSAGIHGCPRDDGLSQRQYAGCVIGYLSEGPNADRAVSSLTTTEAAVLVLLLEKSVAVKLTGVLPSAKNAGTSWLMIGTGSTASVALAPVKNPPTARRAGPVLPGLARRCGLPLGTPLSQGTGHPAAEWCWQNTECHPDPPRSATEGCIPHIPACL